MKKHGRVVITSSIRKMTHEKKMTQMTKEKKMTQEDGVYGIRQTEQSARNKKSYQITNK